MQPIRVSTVTYRQRVRIGNRTLSKDEWAGRADAQRCDRRQHPRREEAREEARKSGKGVVETLAAIRHPQFRGRGPLHMAAWAGRLEMCRFLVEELRLNVKRLAAMV